MVLLDWLKEWFPVREPEIGIDFPIRCCQHCVYAEVRRNNAASMFGNRCVERRHVITPYLEDDIKKPDFDLYKFCDTLFGGMMAEADSNIGIATLNFCCKNPPVAVTEGHSFPVVSGRDKCSEFVPSIEKIEETKRIRKMLGMK